MSVELTVGIVGFGGAGIAQLEHFNNIRNSRVVAIFDPHKSAIKRAGSVAPRVLATDNFDEFMASGINTIAVCSPDRTHAEYVVAALQAGKHVVCEKPLTDSLDGCSRMLKAEARAKSVVAAVQHQMRFLPVHVEMRRLIKSGKLGKISYIEGYYVHNLTSRAYLYDNWRFTDNATPLVYSGCHFVDLLRWLLQDEVEEVTGMSNNIAFPEYPESDLNVLLFRFRSGVVGKVVVAFGAARPQDHSVRVYGSEMSIENNLLFSKNGNFEVFARPHLTTHPSDRKERHYKARLNRYLTYGSAWLFEVLMRGRFYDGEYGISCYPIRLYPHRLAVRASLQNFANSVQQNEPLECTLKDSARTVATCLAGVEAYRTGKTVQVSDFWLPDLN